MGVDLLRALTPFVKEALHGTVGVAKFLCLLHVTGTYLCTGAKLVGPSMLPDLDHGTYVLAERITSRLGKIGPGDVVLIRKPDDPTTVVTKRVKGVEGDVISYILDPEISDEQKTVVVPKGHVWIEGDNSYKSIDSRHYGPVPYALLHSRVFFVVWPNFRSIGNKVL